MRRIALIACLTLSPPALAAPAVDSTTQQALRAAEVHWSAYQTQSANCGFASPVLDLAERHSIALQRKLSAAMDKDAAKARAPLAPAVKCSSPENNALLAATQIMAWEAMVRTNFYFQLNAMNSWADGLSEVKVFNSASGSALARQVEQALIKQNSQQAVDNRKESLRQEVVAVLMLMCPTRRPGGSRCPEVPVDLKGQEALAHIRLLEAEAFATDLAKVDEQVKRGEIGTAWRIAKNAKDTRSECRSGDKVIYPQAPDRHAAVLPGNYLVRLRDWGKWSDGSVATVHDQQPGYSLLISPELGVTMDDAAPRPLVACRLD